MENLGELLLKYIKLNNYTQTAFAMKMNISLSTLNKYILNKRQIPLDNLIRFAKELDFSLDYALGILNNDSNKLTKAEFELIKKLRRVEPQDYDTAYDSISNLLELIKKSENGSC